MALRPVLRILTPALFLVGCFGHTPPNDDIPPRPSPAIFPHLPGEPSLQVLVLGDWGTGGEGQQEVADAAAVTHAQSPPAFVLTVGDNFYPEGVSGPGDPLWRSHFEEIYSGPFWEGLTFFPTLGNHDYMGSIEGQLQYSLLSDRWEISAPYYTIQEELPGGGEVLFLALDTNPFADGGREKETQFTWADSILDEATQDWILAYGHHPVATGGWHGPDGSVQDGILPLLEKGVSLYLAGHNHSTELIETGVGPLQAICGGGGGIDNAYEVDVRPETLSAFTNGGWCYLRIWQDALAIDLYDRGGGLQFRHLIRK